MWKYQISTGILTAPDGEIEGHGYSGAPQYRNDTSAVAIHNEGPLPPGLYKIGKAFNHPTKGPLCMELIPNPLNNMFGRSGLLIHGDSIKHPGTASEGCIIQGRSARLAISLSDDDDLEVVA